MAINQSARTAAPWWLSLFTLFGLVTVFLGRRALVDVASLATACTYVGIALVVVAIGLRGWAMATSSGDRRRVERTLLLLQLGSAAALVIYWLATKHGATAIGKAESGRTWGTPLTVLWCVVMLASIIPHFMIELALGTARRSGFVTGSADGEGVEYLRVRDIGWSGLSVAFAASLLMVTCNVANQKNIRRDVSYFKTSSPGESTQNIVRSSSETIKALLFFPTLGEVKAEVRNYFEDLAKATGKITIEEHDRLVSAELAAKHKVSADGSIVLVRGDKSELITVETDFEKARKGAGKLRNLDKEVNALLMKVMREKRKAYLTIGHGELNDRGSISPLLKDKIQERQSTLIKPMLGFLGYDVVDIGPADLATEIPKDCTVLMIVGPSQAFEAAELATIDRYLLRGGRILMALNPLAEADLGPLGSRLGLTLNRALLTDNKAFFPERGTDSDFRNVATTKVSAHASTTAMSRASRIRLPVVWSGSLRDAEFGAVPGVTEKPKRTYIIFGADTTWADQVDDFKFDDEVEKIERYNVGAAIEGPRLPLSAEEKAAEEAKKGQHKDDDGHGHDAAKTDKDGFRALVYANANFLADVEGVDMTGRRRKVMIGGDFFLFDAVRWLGGEEVFSGEVVSEDDKPIKHTKKEDAVWFTLTLLGAPALVLGAGLLGTMLRRRKRKPASKAQAGVAQ